MLTVKKFLCFTLQTGGLVISWLLLIVFIILGCIVSFSLIKALITCKDWKDTQRYAVDNDLSCYDVNSVTFLALLAVILIGLSIISCMGIIGTKRGDGRLVKPIMILEGFMTIGSIMSVASNPIQGIFLSAVNTYAFIVTYSYCKKLQQDKEQQSKQEIQLSELTGATYF